MYWNDDIVDLVYRHLSASIIQDKVRRNFFKHVHHAQWLPLRRMLLQTISTEEYKVLQASSNVRREWRNEPSSWIYTVLQEPTTLEAILTEVRAGVWM